MSENRLSVSRLNMLISQEITLSPFLGKVDVEGELARFVRHGKGHLYFTLKDDYSSIDCVIFQSDASRLKEPFEEGDRVALTGRVGIYEKNARLQFYARTMRPLGEGIYLRQFALLKEKLTAEGLLDPERKMPLPRFPGRVALLTSPIGAAQSDFRKIFHTRNPLAQLEIIPIPLQGDGAAQTILSTLASITEEDYDLVVITRGGGSYEDLREFNDEALARFLADYPIPTICAIGHEIDVTIAELTASQRGATPSEAAQLATADLSEAVAHIGSSLNNSVLRRRDALLHLQERLRLEVLENLKYTFSRRKERELSRLSEQVQAAGHALRYRLKSEQESLEGIAQHLEALSPLKILSRGYALVKKDGMLVRDAKKVKTGDRLQIQTSDATIHALVEEIVHEIQ